jgi:putative nucleotidyltransferase with HDIG domain
MRNNSSGSRLGLALSERPDPVLVYLAVLAGGCALLVTSLLSTMAEPLPDVWAVAALAFVAAAFETSSVRLSRTTESSIALLPVVFAAVLFGPVASMIVAAVSLVTDLRRPYLKWAVYTCSRSVTGAMTGIAAVGSDALIDNHVAGIGISTLFGAVVAETLDLAFAAYTHRLRRNGPMRNVARLVGPLAVACVPLYAPVVAALALAYQELSAWTLPLFFGPALAAQRLFGLYREQRALADELRAANTQLERANLSFATALVATLDARDRYTAGHSAAVAVYARDIAARMELSEREQELAHLCGLVHDIGKIGLPPGLLEKPGPLTLEERRQMEEHAVIGERILSNVDDYAEIASIVRHHHERVDGEGYPDGLCGNEIPLIARILSVADAYNAMTSDRPYRDALPSRVARLRLAQAVDSQFDTSIVAAFEAILAGADETYRVGRLNPFAEALTSPEIPAPIAAVG